MVHFELGAPKRFLQLEPETEQPKSKPTNQRYWVLADDAALSNTQTTPQKLLGCEDTGDLWRSRFQASTKQDFDAVKMASKATNLSPSSSSSRPTYSCVRCSDRKVKCDRQYPCNACVRHGVQCVFRAPPPPRRKPKRAKELNLKERLKRYEGLLQDLGVDPTVMANTADFGQTCRIAGSKGQTTRDSLLLPTPASSTTEVERSITTSQVLQGSGRSKIVDK